MFNSQEVNLNFLKASLAGKQVHKAFSENGFLDKGYCILGTFCLTL